MKVSEKVQTLLTEVLRCCDSILEALGGTKGDGGAVVLGVGGGISNINIGSDTTRDNIGAAHNGIPCSGGEVILLRDGGFEWPVGSTLGTRTLNTKTSGDDSRGKHLDTDDNLDREGLGNDATALGGGGPSGKSLCGLGREGHGDGSGVPRQLGGDCDVVSFCGWRWPERA
ncbi:hypothetical protein GUJ93_ZPchr0030g33464 [Zizania palustris]|uniref:Uncharacterized protein n=1 Tax=Zizania palustris TaxID=103762 RepID=A0A8J5QQH8_ZIZPA|nr:hypothetical protein GUJ93_ZPchr0030g33464 [Zizania palustris]